MYDNDSRGISYTGGFFMLIAFMIAGAVLSMQLSQLLWTLTGGEGYLQIRQDTTHPQHNTVIRISQMLTSVVGFFVPALVTARLLNRKPIKLLGFKGKPTWEQVFYTIFIIAVALFAASAFAYFTQHIPLPDSLQTTFDKLEDEYTRQAAANMNMRGIGDYLFSMLIMALLPAICEETLFRGGMQNFLSRGTGKPWLAIIVVSLLFSLAHFSYYGFLSRVVLGIALGAIFQYSGKLWLSILAHFVNNGLIVTILYVQLQQGKPVEEAMRDGSGNLWGIVAIPLLIGLLFMFKKISAGQRRMI